MSCSLFEKRTFSEQDNDTVLEIGGVRMIWRWFDGEYRVHCVTQSQYEKILRWKGSRHGSTSDFPNGRREYDVTIQEAHVERAQKLLEQSTSETPEIGAIPLLNHNELWERKSS